MNAPNDALDEFDFRILEALQRSGRLTSQELAEAIGLSPSQCARRRARLEAQGIIRGYHAAIARETLGLGFVVIITVTLATHNRDNARRFAKLLSGLPQVLEAYALTGEMDYSLKVVAADLSELSEFVNDILLPHDSVQHVKTAIVLDTLKEFSGLPVRLGRSAPLRASRR